MQRVYIVNFYIIRIFHSDTSNVINMNVFVRLFAHIPLSFNALYSHLHLSLFHRCLLLQTLAFHLHLHLRVSCHSMCLVSLVLYIRLNTLTFIFLTTSETHKFECGSFILLQLPQYLFTLILQG